MPYTRTCLNGVDGAPIPVPPFRSPCWPDIIGGRRFNRKGDCCVGMWQRTKKKLCAVGFAVHEYTSTSTQAVAHGFNPKLLQP